MIFCGGLLGYENNGGGPEWLLFVTELASGADQVHAEHVEERSLLLRHQDDRHRKGAACQVSDQQSHARGGPARQSESLHVLRLGANYIYAYLLTYLLHFLRTEVSSAFPVT